MKISFQELLRGFVSDDIEAHRKRDDTTDDNLLPERGHVQNVQAIADHGQQDGTNQSARCFSGSASK